MIYAGERGKERECRGDGWRSWRQVRMIERDGKMLGNKGRQKREVIVDKSEIL